MYNVNLALLFVLGTKHRLFSRQSIARAFYTANGLTGAIHLRRVCDKGTFGDILLR
jgi:hypothetical protein